MIEKKARRPEKLKRKQPGSGPKNCEKKQPGRGPEHLFVLGSRCQQAGEVYPAGGSLTRKGKMWWRLPARKMAAGWSKNGREEKRKRQEEKNIESGARMKEVTKRESGGRGAESSPKR